MSTVDKIKALAAAEVGYREGRSGGHWNNREKYAAKVPGLAWVSDEGQPWCAVFNSWLDLSAGLTPDVDFPVTASCDAAAAWFKKAGRWSEYPAVGAWVLFGTPSDLSHTGRVVRFDDDYIYTVEGNTNDSGSREGDGVYAKRHGRREARVVGYGYPKFPEGIDSADPAYASQKPKPAAPKPKPADKPADQAAPVRDALKGRPTVRLKRVLAAAKRDPKAKSGTFVAKADVEPVEAALVKLGLLDKEYADGHYGTKTIDAYAAFQRSLGFRGDDADGYPGFESLRRLGFKHGFDVEKN